MQHYFYILVIKIPNWGSDESKIFLNLYNYGIIKIKAVINMVIEIVDYDENWPLKYAAEANNIRNIISSDLVSIYHIGSTAIKGLKARAIIDILIVVKKIELIDELKKKFEDLDYECLEKNENLRGYYFKKKNDGFNLYVFSVDDVSEIEKYLAVSFYLKEHQDVAYEYADFKVNIASKCRNNKKYFKEKNKFIAEIEKDAYKWYHSKNIHIV